MNCIFLFFLQFLHKMTNNVTALAEELAQAVELIMHPSSAQQSRMEAYMACERFKEASPLCAQVGLYLASNAQFSQNVRHFGLQLMEYTIKFKWNCIGQEEKVFIKVSNTWISYKYLKYMLLI